MRTKKIYYLAVGLLIASCGSPEKENLDKSLENQEYSEDQEGESMENEESESATTINYNTRFTSQQLEQKSRLNQLLEKNTKASELSKGNCQPLIIKRGTTIRIGNLKIKKGSPLALDGFELSVKGVDACFDALMAFDIASNNVCIVIDQLPPAGDKDSREFVMKLLDKEERYLQLFIKFKMLMTTARSEAEFMNSLNIFEEKVSKVSES